MSIKKSFLLSLATAAVALTAFAPSAMAADGVIRDVSTNAIIPNGTVLHAVGWARFEALGSGIECHVTGNIEASGSTGTTGHIPLGGFVINTSSCHGYGVAYANCTVTADEVQNLPYHVTVTPTDLDVTGNIIITSTLGATPGKTCNFSFTNLEYEEITLTPLATGTRVVTNTENHLGGTASQGTAIAGVELEGEGLAENDLGVFENAAEGELEITSPNRCTWKIAAS